MPSNRNILWLSRGAGLLCLAVILGAFGTHILKSIRDPYFVTVFEKGVSYQVMHAFGIVIVGILGLLNIFPENLVLKICRLFLIGIIFFSGSLYLLAITELKSFGAITPIGGVLFIFAWGILSYQLYLISKKVP